MTDNQLQLVITVIWLINLVLYYRMGSKLGYRKGYAKGAVDGAQTAITMLQDHLKQSNDEVTK